MTVAAPVVQGDGTTARSRARARWRRWAPWLALAVLAFVVSGVVSSRQQTPAVGQNNALDPNGTRANGSRALAQVLHRHGVDVHRATDVEDAAASDGTIVVINSQFLKPAALERFNDSEADLVLVEPSADVLAAVAPTIRRGRTPSPTGEIAAGCADPAARRAGRISGGGQTYWATDGATSCFSGTYLRTLFNGHHITVIGQPDILTNGHILDAGNAALAVNTLGDSTHLTWLMSDPLDPLNAGGGDDDETSPLDLLPRWFGPLVLMALVSTLTLALWRGRRLGRLVREPLPVVVPAAETVRGRATLYRAAGAYHRSLAVHRATALRTAAGMLGLPTRSDATTIVQAWADATGRPDTEVAAALTAPTRDAAAMLRCVETIDTLLDALAAATGRRPVHTTPVHPTKGHP